MRFRNAFLRTTQSPTPGARSFPKAPRSPFSFAPRSVPASLPYCILFRPSLFLLSLISDVFLRSLVRFRLPRLSCRKKFRFCPLTFFLATTNPFLPPPETLPLLPSPSSMLGFEGGWNPVPFMTLWPTFILNGFNHNLRANQRPLTPLPTPESSVFPLPLTLAGNVFSDLLKPEFLSHYAGFALPSTVIPLPVFFNQCF